MSETIYMVTKGRYSDYGVVGLFSTLGAAEKVCAILRESRIEERELDKYVAVAERGLTPYDVTMGREGDCDIYEWGYLDLPATPQVRLGPDGEGAYMMVECWARDKKHAIKIANEIRGQIIAAGNWRVGYVWLADVSEQRREP